MSENSKSLAYEYEYEFFDHETCMRAGVAIACMIDLSHNLKLEAGLPQCIQFDADGNTLYIRTSTEAHVIFDKFIDVFFEINSRFIEE